MATNKKNSANKNFTVLLIAVAVIGAGLLGYVSMRPKGGGVAVDPNLPMGTAKAWTMGSDSAPVKIIEFADFECPACGQFATVTEPDLRERLVKTGMAQIQFYVFPLPMHKNTWPASNAAFCAGEQGKFWEMHDRLFYTQDLWNTQATSNPNKKMAEYAKDIGLDQSAFEKCFDSQKFYPDIKASGAHAEQSGIDETPSFIIGGKKYPGAQSYDQIKKLVDAELAAVASKADAGKKSK